MVIVYAATRNLYPRLRGAVASLLAYNKPDKIYLLIEDDDLPDAYKPAGPCVCMNAVRFRDKYVSPDGVNRYSVFSWQALLRTAYSEIFPEDKILSLDVDTIVRGSLAELWETDLTGAWFAMVPEKCIPQWRPSLYYPKHKTYCNAGVCLYNLAQLRADGMFQKFRAMIDTVRMDYCEQDTFNHFGWEHGKIKLLPLTYNNCIGCGYSDNPIIQHYAGVRDKWQPGADFYRREWLTQWHSGI